MSQPVYLLMHYYSYHDNALEDIDSRNVPEKVFTSKTQAQKAADEITNSFKPHQDPKDDNYVIDDERGLVIALPLIDWGNQLQITKATSSWPPQKNNHHLSHQQITLGDFTMTNKIYVILEITASTPTEPGIARVLQAFDNKADAEKLVKTLQDNINELERDSNIHVSLSYCIKETDLIYHRN